MAFDKSAGDLAVYTYKDLEDSNKRIKKVIADTSCKKPPKRAFETVTERKTNKQKLGVNCSYCSHKNTCWEDVGLDLQFKSGRPVFYVPTGEENNVHGF